MAPDGVLESSDRPFPWLFECAAAIEGESVTDLYTDSGTIARSLAGAADLFELPAVSVSFDTALEAEAAGCDVDMSGDAPTVTDGCVATLDDAFEVPIAEISERGRVPAFVDAVERLQATVDDVDVFGGITGPNQLTDHLLDEPESASQDVEEEVLLTAGDVGAEIASAYLDAGADGIAVLEPDGIERAFYTDPATAITNVLDHYEVTGVLVTKAVTGAEIERAAAVGFDAVTGRVESPDDAIETAAENDVTLGVGIPGERFSDGPEAVSAFLTDVPSNAPISSEWTVPRDTAPETIHSVMDSA